MSAQSGGLTRTSRCYLSQGGLHENGKYANCTGGITGYIDRLIFSERHLYKYPTCKAVYGRRCVRRGAELALLCLECGTFDPENLFGALPTMFLAYLGIQAGRILGMVRSRCLIVAPKIVVLLSSDVQNRFRTFDPSRPLERRDPRHWHRPQRWFTRQWTDAVEQEHLDTLVLLLHR